MAEPGAGIFRVAAGAAVVRVLDGSERYLYKGAMFDATTVDAASVEHLVSAGLIVQVEIPEGEPSEVKAEVEIPEGEPSEEWSAKQLDAYAAALGIDLGTGKNKAEKVAAIAAASA